MSAESWARAFSILPALDARVSVSDGVARLRGTCTSSFLISISIVLFMSTSAPFGTPTTPLLEADKSYSVPLLEISRYRMDRSSSLLDLVKGGDAAHPAAKRTLKTAILENFTFVTFQKTRRESFVEPALQRFGTIRITAFYTQPASLPSAAALSSTQ